MIDGNPSESVSGKVETASVVPQKVNPTLFPLTDELTSVFVLLIQTEPTALLYELLRSVGLKALSVCLQNPKNLTSLFPTGAVKMLLDVATKEMDGLEPVQVLEKKLYSFRCVCRCCMCGMWKERIELEGRERVDCQD